MGLVAARIEREQSSHPGEVVQPVRSFSGTLETGQLRIVSSLMLSSLILLNYVLFEGLAFLCNVSGLSVARHPAMLLFCFCALVQSLLLLPVLFHEVVQHVDGGNVSRNVLHFMIISCVTLGLGYQVVAAIDALFFSNLIALVLAAHCIIALDRTIEFSLAAFLDRASIFSLDAMVSDVRIPSMSGEKTEGCVVTSRWQDARALRPGDVYQVKAGEVLPCDGIVLDGVASLTERYLSGAPEPVCKGRGDEVCAGSSVEKGSIICKVVNRLDDSIFTTFIPHIRTHLRAQAEALQSMLVYMSIFHYAIIILALSYGIYGVRAGMSLPEVFIQTAALLFLGLIGVIFPAQRFLSAWVELGAFVNGVVLKTSSTWKQISNIARCAIHYERKAVPGALRVQHLQKLDQRVEDETLHSVLMSLSGSGQDEADRAIARFLTHENPEVDVYSVDNYHYYSDRGVCGIVNQIDVTLGTEEFLIERGVYLQESDTTVEEGERVRYLAFNEELVACIHYFPRGVQDGRECGRLLKLARVPMMLLSHGSQEVLERYRKRINVDVSGAHAELEPGESVRLVQEGAPLLVFGDRGLPLEIEYAARKTEGVVTAARFNELEWSVTKYDATTFIPDLEVLGRVILITRLTARLQSWVQILGVGLFLAAGLLYPFVGVSVWAFMLAPLCLYPLIAGMFYLPETKAMYPLLFKRQHQFSS